MGEGDFGRPAGIHGVQVDPKGRGLSAGIGGGRGSLGTQVERWVGLILDKCQ